MRLATFTLPGETSPVSGQVVDERVVAFDDGTTVADRLEFGDLHPAAGESWPLSEVTLLAPVPRPRAIFGIGLNYAAHARETGGSLPEAPIVFQKLPSSSTAPNGTLHIPKVVRRLDYEGELVVVMGAENAVAGYAIANDVSARDLQRREPQWTRAKGFDESCPWGPWITTTDEVSDAESLRLRTWVNGDLRQDSSTSDLVFGIDALVAFISAAITFEPGDLILTGTPSGVGQAMDPPHFLDSGDVVRIEIESLGAIEHSIA